MAVRSRKSLVPMLAATAVLGTGAVTVAESATDRSKRAADRGVTIHVVIESPDHVEGKRGRRSRPNAGLHCFSSVLTVHQAA